MALRTVDYITKVDGVIVDDIDKAMRKMMKKKKEMKKLKSRHY